MGCRGCLKIKVMANQAQGPEFGQGSGEFVVSFSSPKKGSSVCQVANSGRTQGPLGYSETSTITPLTSSLLRSYLLLPPLLKHEFPMAPSCQGKAVLLTRGLPERSRGLATGSLTSLCS